MIHVSKDVKKIKLNFLDFLKSLSKYLTSKNRDTASFIKLIEKYDISKPFLFNRLITYNYNNPYILYYINKYMNSKFDFYNYEIDDFLESITLIMDQNNQKKLFFLKSNEYKDNNYPKIKKLLKEYYLTTKQKLLNDSEITYLYELFTKGAITYNELNRMNEIINNEKLKLDHIEMETKTDTNSKEILEYFQTRILPKDIYDFCIDLKEQKSNIKKCHSCKLYENGMVVLDTNLENINETLDFMFINLYPNKSDSLYNKPMIGNENEIFRNKLYKLDNKWMITNAIMCCANTQKDLGKTDKEIFKTCSNCNSFMQSIIKKFPSKIYVLLGKHVNQLFEIEGSVVQNNGKVVKLNNKIFLSMISPNMVNHNKELNLPLFNNAWDVIYQIGEKLNKKEISQEKQKPKTDAILTYFDSVNLNDDQILNIYIDQDGNKHYEKVDYVMPIYVKYSEYNDRPIFDDNFDYVVNIRGKTKYKLNSMLKDNLRKHKYHAIDDVKKGR